MASSLFKFKTKIGSDSYDGKIQMKTTEAKLEMSDDTFIALRDVIYKLCGIYYTESKKYLLEGRIAKRLIAKNISSFEEYVEFIKSPFNRQEINQLFEAITINETYFFRAEQQFEAFEKIIVPEILKSKAGGSQFFRVWSAACSTGEEAYTVAIIILEKLKPLFPNIQFQILASDINNAVLDIARAGIYKEYSIRNVPPYILNKYFTKQGSSYLLSDEVKSLVRFTNINLYDQAQMRTVNSCDIIFCCNVLIYFDVPSKQQVVSYLFDSLNKNGYLFIGYSESLHGISKAFKLIHLPKAMAYKKE
jgi:chemotaxis protein methyltransferase CheR